jgi:hypothetical protein
VKAAERSRIELQLKGSRNGSGSFATTRRASSLARCVAHASQLVIFRCFIGRLKPGLSQFLFSDKSIAAPDR